ncbi:hypothetical protein CAFEA_10920 [Corynebacterium afermentans subsp. afermentans]|uniref:Uncharacterized protein n=1 Tax=Corynebacterium afermentans TaxID=38286 RepID=A0A9X8WIU2_9CORY|nr:hypothetical protein [Corynebacterium afermentans]OAA17419.1 hypothetical protein Caferm_02595 [Corynebacterium afermentans subsp. afermentans]WJY57746.1 hypothetical protein CAFEA_10920 [Corynebacterium afermentans subsp. afermentans]SIQ48967.1 hypothetical protein SAMN05421802_1165 [Corynebacterium afermentans]
MSRSRIATATLACALAVGTVQVPVAEAQSSGSSTSTVDQQGFDKATAKWQPLFSDASASLQQAERDAKAAKVQRDAANAAVRNAEAALTAAEAEFAWAQAADQDALAAAVESARERLAGAEQGVEDAYELSAAEQMTLDEAEDYVAEAEAELAQVNAQRPTLAQYTTTETNTAAVVLGVLAALAVVGIGVVALAPRLGIELPWQ